MLIEFKSSLGLHSPSRSLTRRPTSDGLYVVAYDGDRPGQLGMPEEVGKLTAFLASGGAPFGPARRPTSRVDGRDRRAENLTVPSRPSERCTEVAVTQSAKIDLVGADSGQQRTGQTVAPSQPKSIFFTAQVVNSVH